MHQTQHDAKEDTQTWVQSHKQEPRARPQVTPAQNGCSKAWLLLDCLHAEIGNVQGALEGSEWNELLGYNVVAALTLCTDVPQDEI